MRVNMTKTSSQEHMNMGSGDNSALASNSAMLGSNLPPLYFHESLQNMEQSEITPYIERLELRDYNEVNDHGGKVNCYYCCLAAILGSTVNELYRKHGIKVSSETATPIQIVQLYQKAGFIRTKIVFDGEIERFWFFLYTSISNESSAYFTMLYIADEHISNGRVREVRHALNARAWKSNNEVRIILIDFQKNRGIDYRFTFGMPLNVKYIFVIYDPEFKS